MARTLARGGIRCQAEILRLGSWERVCHEMLWLWIANLRQPEEGQFRRLLFGGLASAPLPFSLDIHSAVAKCDLNPERRVMGRAPPFEKPVGRQPEVAGLRQELQRGF